MLCEKFYSVFGVPCVAFYFDSHAFKVKCKLLSKFMQYQICLASPHWGIIIAVPFPPRKEELLSHNSREGGKIIYGENKYLILK